MKMVVDFPVLVLKLPDDIIMKLIVAKHDITIKL